MKGEEKLQALRKEMQARKYDAYIIPHGDQHDVNLLLTIHIERIHCRCGRKNKIHIKFLWEQRNLLSHQGHSFNVDRWPILHSN